MLQSLTGEPLDFKFLSLSSNYVINYPATSTTVSTLFGTITVNYNNIIPAGSSLYYTINYPLIDPNFNSVYIRNLDPLSINDINITLDSVNLGNFVVKCEPVDPNENLLVNTLYFLYVIS